jgi:hypothetical protein
MRRTFAVGLLVLMAFGIAIGPSWARPGGTVLLPDQVEEDWQLVVAEPDSVAVGPQITTSMSPVSDNSTPFVAFDMNYREYPSFTPGGMQVQVWSGDTLLDKATHEQGQFDTPNETITWTQRMTIGQDGTVQYWVLNGQSTTWGTFGTDNQLHVSFPTSLTSLVGYSPDTSAANSGVSWEADHVTAMTLVQVRYYAQGVLIATDTTPRSIPLGQGQ